jgi:hypothetical protein
VAPKSMAIPIVVAHAVHTHAMSAPAAMTSTIPSTMAATVSGAFDQGEGTWGIGQR